MPNVLTSKVAANIVFTYLETVEPQGRTHTHTTDTDGHLDFSTGKTQGRIIHTDTPVTKQDLLAIVRQHHERVIDRTTGKAIMVFTTSAIAARPREIAFWPVFQISSDASVTPWNKRAKVVHRGTTGAARRHPAVRWAVGAAVIAVLVLFVALAWNSLAGPLKVVCVAVLVLVVGTIVSGILQIGEHLGLVKIDKKR